MVWKKVIHSARCAKFSNNAARSPFRPGLAQRECLTVEVDRHSIFKALAGRNLEFYQDVGVVDSTPLWEKFKCIKVDDGYRTLQFPGKYSWR